MIIYLILAIEKIKLYEINKIFKENFYYNNEFTDTVIYGLLKRNFIK